jgi:FeS assembly SUF system protein
MEASIAYEKSKKEQLEDAVITALQTVYDPEIPVNIWELGLVYSLEISNDKDVLVQMTLTTPNCPVADSLPVEVEEKLIAIPDIGSVRIQLVWDPPWSPQRMSEAAKLELGFL